MVEVSALLLSTINMIVGWWRSPKLVNECQGAYAVCYANGQPLTWLC